MERPKYLEYRHRRDQILRFDVTRAVKASLEKPAPALLRLVGKKTSATHDSFQEVLVVETHVSDVRPDYSGLVKSQVTEATRLVNGEEVGYEGINDPRTDFLNETVDRFGRLTDIAGTLPTPHLLLFPDDPKMTGEEWTRSRMEMHPVCGPDGSIAGHEPMELTYACRVDAFGDDGVEFADVSLSGTGAREQGGVRQEYTVSGTVRFAIREGHILEATLVRRMKSAFDVYTLTWASDEEYKHASQGTQRSVGGMRI